MYNISIKLIILKTIIGSIITQDSPSNKKNIPMERLHIRKCREYQSAVYDYISVSSLVAGDEKIPIDKCGHVNIPLTLGGNLAKPKEFPHMALIGFDAGNNIINWKCCGTLISDRYILIAAHSAYSRSLGIPQFVLLGDLDINSNTNNAKREEFQIEKIFIHPAYSISRKYNDIALIKLTKNIQLNPYIRPACLSTEFDNSEKTLIATNWVSTNWGDENSSYLQKVILDKYNNTECNKMYLNLLTKILKDGIRNDTQICAGSKDNIKDICQDNSGVPLQIYHNSEYCMYTIIGITSLGYQCGLSLPAVYTTVFPYIDWIESIVWPID